MKQHSVNFGFEARYFQLGEINKDTKQIIFVLHGHGQQGKYFIRKFESLDNGSNCIIAPEGLSRYYLKGFSGRVGATWMTKEDRLTDIKNYITYLEATSSKLLSQVSHKTQISILGFSQGTATASRWAASTNMHFDKLILWAGILPPDLNIESGISCFENKEVIQVYGNQDPFITDERISEMRLLYDKIKVEPRILNFEGGHDIDKTLLGQLFL